MSGAFLNRVTLIGNLGGDPERRGFPSGGSVVTLRLATTETYRDGSGERVERTEWHSIAVWPDGLQDVVTAYLRKGAKVLVEGKLRTRRWQDQTGADRHTTEIHVTPYDGRILFLDKARGDAAGGEDEGEPAGDAEEAPGEGGPKARAGRRGRGVRPRTPAAAAAAVADPDDDIPF